MIPAAMALGDGGEFRAPDGHRGDRRPAGLDRAVAGVRAVVLHVMDDAANGTAKLFRRLIKPNAKDEPEDTAGASNVHAMARAAGRELPLAAE